MYLYNKNVYLLFLRELFYRLTSQGKPGNLIVGDVISVTGQHSAHLHHHRHTDDVDVYAFVYICL